MKFIKATALTCVALLVLEARAEPQCEHEFGPASPSHGDLLGRSMDADGDVVVVGGFPTLTANATGLAYVFRRVGDAWTEEQELVGSDVQQGDGFGHVAVDGDTVFVGAATHDQGRGAVYVFKWDGNAWIETQKLTASDGDFDDYFGNWMRLSGDTAVIGAHGHGFHSQMGAAYVFERDAGSWSQSQKLGASDGSGGDKFGFPVEIVDSTIIVGAQDAGIGGQVYVFEYNGFGWSEVQKLVPSNPSWGKAFGLRFVLHQDLLVISSRDGPAGQNSGDAYVFLRDSSGWTEHEILAASNASPGTMFGAALATDGARLTVGAPWTATGTVYLFEPQGQNWVESNSWNAYGAELQDRFGSNLALVGETLVATSPWHDGAAPDSGALYSFDLDCRASFEAYCWCDADAPCGNHDASAGCANSTGSGALLLATPQGSNRVAADDLVLDVTGLPSFQFGLVYMGPHQVRVPLGDGLRGVEPGPPAQGFLRFPVHFSGSAGAFAEGPDMVRYSVANFGSSSAITVGSTWNFQAVYRDSEGPCGSGFNLTNALSVTFAP